MSCRKIVSQSLSNFRDLGVSTKFVLRVGEKHSLCMKPEATRQIGLEKFLIASAKFLFCRPLVRGGCALQKEMYLLRRLSWTQPGHLLCWQELL